MTSAYASPRPSCHWLRFVAGIRFVSGLRRPRLEGPHLAIGFVSYHCDGFVRKSEKSTRGPTLPLASFRRDGQTIQPQQISTRVNGGFVRRRGSPTHRRPRTRICPDPHWLRFAPRCIGHFDSREEIAQTPTGFVWPRCLDGYRIATRPRFGNCPATTSVRLSPVLRHVKEPREGAGPRIYHRGNPAHGPEIPISTDRSVGGPEGLPVRAAKPLEVRERVRRLARGGPHRSRDRREDRRSRRRRPAVPNRLVSLRDPDAARRPGHPARDRNPFASIRIN